jgi:hypothetical protein
VILSVAAAVSTAHDIPDFGARRFLFLAVVAGIDIPVIPGISALSFSVFIFR